MFLHPLSLRVSPPRTFRIRAFFLGNLSADLRLWVSRSQGAARQAHCRGWRAAPKESEPPREFAPAPAARSAHSLSPASPAPTDAAGLSPPSWVRLLCLGFPHQLGTAATAASRHSGPSQAGMKGWQGQGCAGRGERAAKASRSRWGVTGCGRGRARARPRERCVCSATVVEEGPRGQDATRRTPTARVRKTGDLQSARARQAEGEEGGWLKTRNREKSPLLHQKVGSVNASPEQELIGTRL